MRPSRGPGSRASTALGGAMREVQQLIAAPRGQQGRAAELARIRTVPGRARPPMPDTTVPQHLRVLIANEKRDRLELLAQVVIGLGHEVIAREIYVKEVGSATARERPDVAIVGLGLSSEHALDLIGEIVREASCPVIALLHANDPAYIHEAAKRGVFAYIIEGPPRSCRARSTSRSSASPSTRTCRAPSAGGRRSSRRRGS